MTVPTAATAGSMTEAGFDAARPPVRPAVRLVWILLGVVAAALHVLSWGPSALVELARSTETVDTSFPADSVTAVEVRSEGGPVEVIGGAPDRATVSATVAHGLLTTDYRAELEGSTLVITADCPWGTTQRCSAAVTVSVPSAVSVTVSTPDAVSVESIEEPVDVSGDSGPVTLTGVDAPVTVRSDSGDIQLDDLSGPVTATTDSGSVTGQRIAASEWSATSDWGNISVDFTTPPDRVEVVSADGNVRIVVPGGENRYRVAVSAGTDRAEIGVVQDPDSPHDLDLRSETGQIRVIGAD